MNHIERILLTGLGKHGRTRTFLQILNDAGVNLDAAGRIELANTLEAAGLIKNVTYQLPVAIRAELTEKGKQFLSATTGDASNAVANLLFFLQMNLVFLY